MDKKQTHSFTLLMWWCLKAFGFEVWDLSGGRPCMHTISATPPNTYSKHFILATTAINLDTDDWKEKQIILKEE